MSRYKEAISTSKWPKFALSRLQYHLDNSSNSSESIVKFGSHVRLVSDQRRLFWGKYVVSYTFIYPLDLRLTPEPESSAKQKLTRNNRAYRWEPHNVFRWIIRGNMSAISVMKVNSLQNCFKFNRIALILSRSIRQMLVIFSGVEFFKTVSKFRKRKRKSLSFTSSTKHEIRHFHVPSHSCSDGKEMYKKA